MAKTTKTNAMRMLDRAKIPYEVFNYDYDESDLSGVHAAAELGENPKQVFKTLVTKGAKGGNFVFCIPVDEELDLKKAAKSAGVKSVEMIHVKDLQGLTGYIRGGCSPVGMKKQFPTYVDSSARNFETIFISAGMRGWQLKVNPNSLVKYINGEFTDITAK